jgi:2,4-dienoyl-CoA reductase-like NADH-dependent reductase (Old Yellow Enzyme family)
LARLVPIWGKGLPYAAQRQVCSGAVDFVGLGRMMLAYSDFPADVLAGRCHDRKRLCRTFSDCTTASRHRLVSGCYPLEPFCKARPQREQLVEIKTAR